MEAARQHLEARIREEQGDEGPSWNSFRDAAKVDGRKPVICVAGLASGSLEARYEGSDNHEVTYCSIKALATQPKRTLESLALRLSEGELRDGRVVPCTADPPGVEHRPVHGTAGISSLNPGELVGVDVWKGFINAFHDRVNVHAYNYDWRRWGDQVYIEEMEDDFKFAVEESVTIAGGQKATLIGHSMGASVILYMLSVLGDHWVKEHVGEVVLVAPAHVGSPCMLPNLAHGVIHPTSTGHFHNVLPENTLLGHLDTGMGDLCGSWACMAAEMPTMVGGASPYSPDHVFATTPDKSYTLSDLGQFLEDAASQLQGRELPAKLWPGIQEVYSKIKAPIVSTHILYGDKIDTISKVVYGSSDVTKPCIETSSERGDGTITAPAIERLAAAWIEQGADVSLVKCPEEVSHKNLIVDSSTLQYVQGIVDVVSI
jgi:pimeloyl-ACP methyl ester carboxylesterase